MNKLSAIFKEIGFPSPPDDLEEKIFRRIKVLEGHRARRAILITRIGRAISLLAFLFIGWSFGQSLISSEFWQLASLLFTDASVVMHHFSEFLYSLLETLPAFLITLILVPILSFLLFQFWSLSINKHSTRYSPLTFQNV